MDDRLIGFELRRRRATDPRSWQFRERKWILISRYANGLNSHSFHVSWDTAAWYASRKWFAKVTLRR